MAKTVTISKAEYEYMQTVIAQDGMTLARLEVELAQAKRDIRRLLTVANSTLACKYCSHDPETCGGVCEITADWRGYGRDAEE